MHTKSVYFKTRYFLQMFQRKRNERWGRWVRRRGRPRSCRSRTNASARPSACVSWSPCWAACPSCTCRWPCTHRRTVCSSRAMTRCRPRARRTNSTGPPRWATGARAASGASPRARPPTPRSTSSSVETAPPSGTHSHGNYVIAKIFKLFT